MTEFFKNSKNIVIAILSGVLPAVFWLWFWFKEEDNEQKHHIWLITLTFIMGSLMVFIAIWLEKYSLNFITNNTTQIIVWASIEELLKLVGVMAILKSVNIIKKPIDYPMYFIAVALGFAALENVLYLIEPLKTEGAIVGILTGHLRFLGSTLLHATASGMIGIALGLAYYLKRHKSRYILIGISFAILLHSTFNFFIMKRGGENFLSIFGFLWVVVIINILIFEKLRRMKKKVLYT